MAGELDIRKIEALPATLIAEWSAYDQLEGLPDPYWIGAEICWAISVFMGTSKKRFQISDFIPREKPVKVMSGEAGKAFFETLLARAKAAKDIEIKLSRGRMGEDVASPD